ncbi:MAG: hypothetical protein OQK82_03600 [Candidatus Pacearchaeota archaeon]|nr:hypothetical protein [Candidatus Pacearchaeota archaeon]
MNQNSAVLTNFRYVKYPNISQEKTIERLISSVCEVKRRKVSEQEITEKIERYALSEKKIKHRSVLRYSDNFPTDWNSIIMNTLNNEYKDKKAPEGLVFATGSMFDIPSPLLRFLSAKEWLTTRSYHSFNFGCAGAFPALEIADSAVKNYTTLEMKAVDIFNTDIISRHFGRIADDLGEELKVDEILISTLFADSSIFYTSMREEEFHKQEKDGLRVLKTHEAIIPNSIQATTWLDYIKAVFKLSPLIPEYAGQNLPKFLDELCAKIDVSFEEEKESFAYALHPGGSKILDYVQEGCGLGDDLIANSRKLLYEDGNTSSTSCPTLWGEMINDKNIPYGEKIITVGVGPGLLLGGAILEKIKSEYSK